MGIWGWAICGWGIWGLAICGSFNADWHELESSGILHPSQLVTSGQGHIEDSIAGWFPHWRIQHYWTNPGQAASLVNPFHTFVFLNISFQLSFRLLKYTNINQFDWNLLKIKQLTLLSTVLGRSQVYLSTRHRNSYFQSGFSSIDKMSQVDMLVGDML